MALINAVNCNKEFLGAGIGTCEVFLNKEMNGEILVPNNWFLPVVNGAVDLTVADAIELIQQTTFDPIFGAVEFTDNTGDPATVDYTSRITAVVENALPNYQLRYETSVGQHSAIYSKNAFKTKSILLVFNGTIVGAYSPDGTKFVGLKMGMHNAQTLKLPAGDARMGTLVNFQLIDEQQFNRRLAVLTTDMLGFDITSETQPIQSTTITAVATAGDPINVTVNSLNNTNYGIEGLDATNFRVVNVTTNAVVTLSTVTAGVTPGTYVLTPTTGLTAAHVIYVQLYDTVVPVATAIVGDNQLYKGQSVNITVGA